MNILNGISSESYDATSSITVVKRDRKWQIIKKEVLGEIDLSRVVKSVAYKYKNKETGKFFATIYIDFEWQENGVLEEAYLAERKDVNGKRKAGCTVNEFDLDRLQEGKNLYDPEHVFICTLKHKEDGRIIKRAYLR